MRIREKQSQNECDEWRVNWNYNETPVHWEWMNNDRFQERINSVSENDVTTKNTWMILELPAMIWT